MTIHLIRLCVGVKSIEELAIHQNAHHINYHGYDAVPGWTRRKPKREKELLDDGSIYWVINSRIQVRQRLLGFEEGVDETGQSFCQLIYDPTLIKTVSTPRRPFQGWRYMQPEDAPPDRGEFRLNDKDGPPEDMAEELRALGLVD